jgi:uncharacterized protein with FMN-binding domain
MNTTRRIAITAICSVTALGGLVGAKALAAAVEPQTETEQTQAQPENPQAQPTQVGQADGRQFPGNRGARRGHGRQDTDSGRFPGGQPGGVPTAQPTQPDQTVDPQTANTAAAGEDGTFVGEAASTRYGPVQVEIDVASGVISDIRVVQYPTQDRESAQINAQAVPILIAAGLEAQSADVDTVSGATYTSDGYRKSLQSAIDEAGL